jgi:hypothetical protein
MKCLADFEVLSDLSVVEDNKKLRLVHPAGRYEVHVKNGPKSDAALGHILSVQVILEVPSLAECEPVAEEALMEVLNVLAFVTNARLEYHRALKFGLYAG